jgi:hypothetical protein
MTVFACDPCECGGMCDKCRQNESEGGRRDTEPPRVDKPAQVGTSLSLCLRCGQGAGPPASGRAPTRSAPCLCDTESAVVRDDPDNTGGAGPEGNDGPPALSVKSACAWCGEPCYRICHIGHRLACPACFRRLTAGGSR